MKYKFSIKIKLFVTFHFFNPTISIITLDITKNIYKNPAQQ